MNEKKFNVLEEVEKQHDRLSSENQSELMEIWELEKEFELLWDCIQGCEEVGDERYKLYYWSEFNHIYFLLEKEIDTMYDDPDTLAEEMAQQIEY